MPLIWVRHKSFSLICITAEGKLIFIQTSSTSLADLHSTSSVGNWTNSLRVNWIPHSTPSVYCGGVTLHVMLIRRYETRYIPIPTTPNLIMDWIQLLGADCIYSRIACHNSRRRGSKVFKKKTLPIFSTVRRSGQSTAVGVHPMKGTVFLLSHTISYLAL